MEKKIIELLRKNRIGEEKAVYLAHELLFLLSVSDNEVACCGNCHLPLDNIEYIPKVRIANKKYNP